MDQQAQTPGWGRWGQEQQQANPGYVMMNTATMPSALVQYGSEAPASSLNHRPPVTPEYMMSNSYSMAPMTNLPGSHYPPQNALGFASYTPPSPASVVLPSRECPQERLSVRVPSPNGDRSQGYSYDSAYQSAYTTDQSRSPSVKSEVQSPVQQQLGVPLPVTTKESSTSRKEEEQDFVNHTPIDDLMKVLQSKPLFASKDSSPSPQSRYLSPPPESQTRPKAKSTKPAGCKTKAKKAQKRIPCWWKGCTATFAQNTHLTIHLRKHTKEKPYPCKFSGCGESFTQPGNLKTHMRRHTGERPFPCEICGKRFAQRGNLRAHGSVHDPTKKHKCILDNCNKLFGQLGNLKHHQNVFHKATVNKLMDKYSSMKSEDFDVLPEGEIELVKHLLFVYKNLNKGIKGRGKARVVARVRKTVDPAISYATPYPLQQHTPPMQTSPMPQHAPLMHQSPPQMPPMPPQSGLYQHGLAPYAMCRPPYEMSRTEADNCGYNLYNMSQQNMSAPY